MLHLTPESTAQVQTTLAAWPWPDNAPALASRSRMELELLFSETSWRQALRLLEAWRALELIQRDWRSLPRRSEVWLLRLGQWGHAISPTWSPEELRLVGLVWLVPHHNNLLAIAERLQLAHRQQQLLNRIWSSRAGCKASSLKPQSIGKPVIGLLPWNSAGPRLNPSQH